MEENIINCFLHCGHEPPTAVAWSLAAPLVLSYAPRQCYVPTGGYTDGWVAVAADKTQRFFYRFDCSSTNPS